MLVVRMENNIKTKTANIESHIYKQSLIKVRISEAEDGIKIDKYMLNLYGRELSMLEEEKDEK